MPLQRIAHFKCDRCGATEDIEVPADWRTALPSQWHQVNLPPAQRGKPPRSDIIFCEACVRALLQWVRAKPPRRKK